MRRISMATRDELLKATVLRYRSATRGERGRILDEFATLTGYHRKHAMRLLRGPAPQAPSTERPERRRYGPAVRAALVLLWEASDRICGKRLRPLIPILVASMEKHGHLALDIGVRNEILHMSAATIDRSLRDVRNHANKLGGRRRSKPTGIRASVPIRTFADWNDPAPGFCEADLVAHCGPVANGSFIQTLVVTDIATGWTECAPLIVRQQTVLIEVLKTIRRSMPFSLLGFDTDNDTVFMNETVRDYCITENIVFTRCRYDISPSLLFTWRRVFHAGVSARPETKFVPALVMPDIRPDDPSPASAGRVEIVTRNGRRLIVDASLDSAVIARLLDVVDRR